MIYIWFLHIMKVIFDIKNYPQNVLLFLDGLSNAKEYENGVYLYRYLKPESESK